MPSDYKSAAAALSLQPSPIEDHSPNATPASKLLGAQYADHPSSSGSSSSNDDDEEEDYDSHHPSQRQDTTAPPSFRRHTSSSSSSFSNRLINSRRLNRLHSRATATLGEPTVSLITDAYHAAEKLVRLAIAFYNRISLLQRVLVILACTFIGILGLLSIIYSHQIFSWLAPLAHGFRDIPGGWILVFLLTCATGFPPLIGYSTACTIAGFVYGFPLGWPIVASASVVGSTAAFLTSRGVAAKYVQGLVGEDKRFVALGQVLKKDGLGVLALVRFCPLPFSLSNGFLATVPSVSPLAFAGATALASPKLLVHVFIGSRLAILAEKGDEMTFADRMINYTFMFISALVGMAVGIFIYKRTMARAAVLAREELEHGDGRQRLGSGRRRQQQQQRGNSGGFVDEDNDEEGGGGGDRGGMMGMMDPDDADADAAALMDDDDISLWDQGDDAYVDEEMGVNGAGHANGNGNGNGNGHDRGYR